MHLNQKVVDQLVLPSGKSELFIWDSSFPGFGVRLRQGGSANYVFQYKIGAQHRRISIGRTAVVRFDAARRIAGEHQAKVKLGQDPQARKLEARQRVSETFEPLARRFLELERERWKPRTFLEISRHLLKDARALHALALVDIDRRCLAELLGALRERIGNAGSNRVRSSLSMFLTFALREGLIENNPVIGTNKAPENGKRERLLSDAELRRIWHALPDDQYGAIVKLLALTGSRRAEVGALRWSEIDFEQQLITLPGERTKSRQTHVIPMSADVMAILKAQPRRSEADGSPRDLLFGEGPGPYSGWSKSKSKLDARINAGREAPVPEWRLHDFRRLMSTVLHDRYDIGPHIIETALGHISGHKAGVAGVYNLANYLAQRRQALTLWAEHVANVIADRAGKARNVIKLRR